MTETKKPAEPLVEDDEIPPGLDDQSGADRVDEDVPVDEPDGEVIEDEDLDADDDPDVPVTSREGMPYRAVRSGMPPSPR